MLDDDMCREMAERIVLSHAEDVEYLSVVEMTTELAPEAEDADFRAIDSLIRKAKVTVTWG